MEKRIHIEKAENSVKVKITGNLEKWMKQSLLSWVVVWLALGFYVVYYIFTSGIDGDGKIFFLTYLLFWAWFAYKALYAYLFKVYGAEWITIDSNELQYGREVLGFESVQFRGTTDTVKVERQEEQNRSFGFVYSQSFWVVGNEKLRFTTNDKNKKFGMHLTASEANELLGILNKRIKLLKKL